MKKTITLLTTVLTFLAAEAHASRLFLRTNTFKASANISGQQYFSHDGNFEIVQLRSGSHLMTISQRNGQGNRNFHHGNDSRGKGYRRSHEARRIFRGSIFMPQQSDVYARITPRGHLIIDRVVPIRRNRQNHQPTRRGGGRDYGNGHRDMQYPQKCGTPSGRQRLDKSYFNNALGLIRNASFDSDKRTLAKQFLLNNDVTSQEVLKLIRLMDFESTRLDIAKTAYASTVDPENYFIVNKGFDFSSSITALNRYLQRQRK